jgi:hemerythrin-like domain-containing protein
MDSSKLAEWMKQEGARVSQLAQVLREHIVAVPSGSLREWLAELGRRYDHFAAHLRRMMQIEEDDGYLLPVVEQRPTLLHEVEALGHQHDELRRLTDDLEHTVHHLAAEDGLLVSDCCARLQVFLGHVSRHEEHENHMVLYSFTQDLGTDQ